MCPFFLPIHAEILPGKPQTFGFVINVIYIYIYILCVLLYIYISQLQLLTTQIIPTLALYGIVC